MRYRVVPEEATREMSSAGDAAIPLDCNCGCRHISVWEAMLSASPAPLDSAVKAVVEAAKELLPFLPQKTTSIPVNNLRQVVTELDAILSPDTREGR